MGRYDQSSDIPGLYEPKNYEILPTKKILYL